jgi:DNA polymerase III delta subunit-like protein
LPPETPALRELRGQETALRVLRASLASSRVAGAYLLHGPAGVGRATGAEIFAAALLCASPSRESGCGRCRACRAFVAGTHPDFLSVSAETGPAFKDDAEADRARLDQFTRAARRAAKPGPRRTIQVRALRRMLEFVALAPAYGGRRVALVDAADDLEDAGVALLLKSLEEAPRATTFLVLAGSAESVPDTILSRCQRVRFRPLAPEVVESILRANTSGDPLDDASRALLVRLAQGSAGRAIRAAELGVHAGGAAAARALLRGRSADGCDAACAWLFDGTRDLAVARERLRELVACALLLARDDASATGSGDGLDAWLAPLRTALEGAGANVSPDLVLRALWARGSRAPTLSA